MHRVALGPIKTQEEWEYGIPSTLEERCQIDAFLSMGSTQKHIALQLNRACATISREISRNSGGGSYRPIEAQEAERRRHIANNTPSKRKEDLLEVIREKLLLDWSPEQISGWLKRAEICISHEAIDLPVWKDKRQGGQLYTHLRHSGKKYNRRSSFKAGRGCIPDRVDSDERSMVVARKERLGDWEGDTVIGANHKGALLMLVDRKSKFRLFVRLKSKTAEEVNKGMGRGFNRLLKEHPRFGTINRLVRLLSITGKSSQRIRGSQKH